MGRDRVRSSTRPPPPDGSGAPPPSWVLLASSAYADMSKRLAVFDAERMMSVTIRSPGSPDFLLTWLQVIPNLSWTNGKRQTEP
jgi:hypothetical protein